MRDDHDDDVDEAVLEQQGRDILRMWPNSRAEADANKLRWSDGRILTQAEAAEIWARAKARLSRERRNREAAVRRKKRV